MWMLNKPWIVVATVVAVAATSVYYKVYNGAVDSTQKEQRLEQQQNYIDTRKRIDEETATIRSVDGARERLLARQKTRTEE